MKTGHEISSRPGLLEVLSIKPFFLLWSAQIITQIAFNMLIFILGVFIYGHTRSNTAVSFLYLTVGVPAAVFGILSGVYVDHYRKREVLIYTTLIRMFLILGLFFARSQLWLVYILVAAISVVSQFFIPAEAALIPRFVPPNLLLSANSLFTLTFYSAIIGGFVLGGPLLEILGMRNILWLLILLYLIGIVLLQFVPVSGEKKSFPKGLDFGEVKQNLLVGLRYIQKVVPVKRAIMLMTMAQAIISILMTLGPGFADNILGIKLTDASIIILGPAAVGMIVGALLTGTLGARFRKLHLIKFGIYFSGIVLLFMGLVVRTRRMTAFTGLIESLFSLSLGSFMLPIAVVCFFLLGLANSLIDISCNTVLAENTRDDMRGRVYGVLASIISGVALLPVVVSGVLADLIGVGKMIFVLGVTITIFGILTNNWARRFFMRKI